VILYLVRHAEAVPVGGMIHRDADRPLSPRGEDDAVLMGKAVANLCRDVGLILTSPLVRAVRTGEIFRNNYTPPVVARTSDNLAPGFRYKALLEELSGQRTIPAIIAIGHQPDLSAFIAYLVADGSPAAVAMASAAVAKLSIPDGDPAAGAQLLWLLTPEVVRTITPQP